MLKSDRGIIHFNWKNKEESLEISKRSHIIKIAS